MISITLNYCRCKPLLCRQHVWLFLIPSRESNIVERGDLQSQKKSHIEKVEAGGCLVVIYHCQRTSKEKGFEYFASKYSTRNTSHNLATVVWIDIFKKQDKQIIRSKAAEHCSRLDETLFGRAHKWECKFVSNKS